MDFRIVKPKLKLADHIQAIWSVKVSNGQYNPVTKPLYCDGGSGVTFLMRGEARLDGSSIKNTITFHRYSKKTQMITLTEDTWLCGIRFHPGMVPQSLQSFFTDIEYGADSSPSPVTKLFNQLLRQKCQSAHLATLYRWCAQYVELNNPILTKRAMLLDQTKHGKIGDHFQHNQRQIERNFRQWIGMSPKYFQRLRRVHSCILILRETPDVSLSELAIDQGFSDQAHMTREFNTFVLSTPGEISQKIKISSYG